MKTLMHWTLSLLFVVLTLSLSLNIEAQWRGGTMREYTFNNPMSALAATMVMNKAREEAMARQMGSGSSSGQSTAARASTAPRPQPVDGPPLRFKAAASYLKPRELADRLGSDQAQRDQYFTLMNAVLDTFGKKVAAAGLQNDVAIALSYFFGENIRVYRGLPELSDQQFIDLRNSFAAALLAGGGFTNATDRQKQEMYETLVIYTGLTGFFYDQAKQANNDALTKMSQQLAAQNLQTVTKAPPETLNLTGDGLSVASGTSVSTVQPAGNVMEIRQLALDFKENELRANQLYKGRRLIVTGKVGSIERYMGVTVLVFDRGLLNPETICYFSDIDQLAQLRRNADVTVSATVRGFENHENITVILDDCVLR